MEIWVNIKGFDGYQVSNQGRVRSLDRISHHVKHGKLIARKHRGRILSQNDNGHGYLSVQLGRCNRLYIHRLVADHFISNPNGYEEVNHINADKQDNCVANLEWCSRQHNIIHSVENDLRWKGSQMTQSLLDEESVKKIKRMLRNKTMKQVRIAEMFNVSSKCISDIKLGYTWKHVS